MSGYKNERSFGDIKSAEELEILIDKMIDKKLKNYRPRTHYSAKVLLVYGNGKCDITFQEGDDTIIQNVRIRDGLTVNQGDEVYVMALNSSPNNLCVDLKKE